MSRTTRSTTLSQAANQASTNLNTLSAPVAPLANQGPNVGQQTSPAASNQQNQDIQINQNRQAERPPIGRNPSSANYGDNNIQNTSQPPPPPPNNGDDDGSESDHDPEIEGIFLGYGNDTFDGIQYSAYRVLNAETNLITMESNIKFIDSSFPFKEIQKEEKAEPMYIRREKQYTFPKRISRKW